MPYYDDRGGAIAISGETLRWARFGVIDNGVLIISALAGISLDDWLAGKIGVAGYGAIVGAGVGNAISDAVAGLPEGGAAALGVGLGAMLPVIPVAVAMFTGRKLEGGTAWAVGLSSAGLVGLAFWRRERDDALPEIAVNDIWPEDDPRLAGT